MGTKATVSFQWSLLRDYRCAREVGEQPAQLLLGPVAVTDPCVHTSDLGGPPQGLGLLSIRVAVSKPALSWCQSGAVEMSTVKNVLSRKMEA